MEQQQEKMKCGICVYYSKCTKYSGVCLACNKRVMYNKTSCYLIK